MSNTTPFCNACNSYHAVPRDKAHHEALKCFAKYAHRCTACGRKEATCSADPCKAVQRDRVATMPPPVPLKIRTRYQRMHAAVLLAETLQTATDPRVANTAHEIVTLLGAPASTLNNVLDSFEPRSQAIIRKMLDKTPTPEAHALETLRPIRRSKQNT